MRHPETLGSEPVAYLPQGEVGYERYKRDLEALSGIAAVLAASYDLETLLNSLMEQLSRVLEPVDAGALVFFRPDRDRLVVEVAYGLTLDPDQPWELPVGAGISGKAFQSWQTQVFVTPEETRRAITDASPEGIRRIKAATGGLEQPRSPLNPSPLGDI